MSWHFSQALVAAYSAVSSVASAPCAPSSTIPTHGTFWSPGKTTDASPRSRSGMTYAPSTDDHGAALLTWFLEASRVRTSASPAKVPDWTESEAGYGDKCGASLARFDRESSSWRIPQLSLLEEVSESLPTWPRWATWDEAECWELRMPSGLVALRSLITSASESGLSLPTPCVPNGGRSIAHAELRGKSFYHNGKKVQLDLNQAVLRLPTLHGMSKDGKSNGPSGNELGRAVNRLSTPKQSDADRGDCPSKRNRRTPFLGSQVKRMPTITVDGNYNQKGASPQSGDGLATAVRRLATVTVQDSKNNGAPSQMERNTKPLNAEVGGSLNPPWVEWLMGWPLGWTDCAASAMDKFQQWSASHGLSFNQK